MLKTEVSKSVYKSSNKGGKTVKKDKVESGKLERKVHSECADWLKNHRGIIAKTIYTGGIPVGGRLVSNPAKGIPDMIVFNLNKSKMYWLEFKKTDGGVLSVEQLEWHSWIRKCGGTVHVITSLTMLKEVLGDELN